MRSQLREGFDQGFGDAKVRKNYIKIYGFSDIRGEKHCVTSNKAFGLLRFRVVKMVRSWNPSARDRLIAGEFIVWLQVFFRKAPKIQFKKSFQSVSNLSHVYRKTKMRESTSTSPFWCFCLFGLFRVF